MTASMCRRTALRAAAVVLLAAAANARDRFLHQRGKCLPESFDCYHNYEELTIAMEDIERRYPKNAFLYSVGQSVEGRHLWVLALAGWNPQQHIPIRPEVQLIGNMHGDEKHLAQTVGRELLLRLAHHILTSYESNSDEAVMRVMNTTRVHIMPSMNPDGFERTALGICQMDDDRIARENSHGIDLNRNFPDRWGPKVRSDPLEPETEAVVKWSARLPFTLAANFHGGVVVVNYPYDSAPLPARSDSAEELLSTIDKDGRSVTPDDLEFKQIATDYAQSSQEAAAAVGTYELDKDACYPGDRFANGITNGAQWYTVYGSMQDFLYRERGVFAITVELSCCKAPGANQLELFWRANKHALIQFPLWANTGVIGSVNDNKGPISKATLYVKGRESVPFHVDKHGYFRRVLLPRNEPYILHVDAPGYQPQFVEFAVHPGRHHSPATLKIHLEPLTTTAAPAQEKTTRTTQKASESESTDYYYYPELFETDATTRAHPTSPSTFIQTIKATLEVLVQTEVHTEPTMSTGLLEANNYGSASALISETAAAVCGDTDTYNRLAFWCHQKNDSHMQNGNKLSSDCMRQSSATNGSAAGTPHGGGGTSATKRPRRTARGVTIVTAPYPYGLLANRRSSQQQQLTPPPSPEQPNGADNGGMSATHGRPQSNVTIVSWPLHQHPRLTGTHSWHSPPPAQNGTAAAATTADQSLPISPVSPNNTAPLNGNSRVTGRVPHYSGPASSGSAANTAPGPSASNNSAAAPNNNCTDARVFERLRHLVPQPPADQHAYRILLETVSNVVDLEHQLAQLKERTRDVRQQIAQNRGGNTPGVHDDDLNRPDSNSVPEDLVHVDVSAFKSLVEQHQPAHQQQHQRQGWHTAPLTVDTSFFCF